MKTAENDREQMPDPEELSLYGDGTDGIPVDDCLMPFEEAEEYSDAPLEFEEMAQILWERLNETYAQSVRYCRHSPHYQELCDLLEKNIKLLGRMCVTKAVLEQKGLSFPALDELTVLKLYSMVSLHFRKCNRAYCELRDDGRGLDMSLLSRLIRWTGLAEQLRATEEKIRKIRSGKISADRMLERAEVFRGESRRKRPEREQGAIRKAAALPVLGSFAREVLREKKREEAENAREQRKFERELEAMMPKPLMPKKSDLARIREDLMFGGSPEDEKKFEEWMALEEPLPPEEALACEPRRIRRKKRKKKR